MPGVKASGAAATRDTAVAALRALRTVEPVPTTTSSLHQAARIDRTRRSLGKIGRLDGAERTAGPALRLVEPAAPTGRLSFPCGARTRKVDSSSRLKFTGDDRPSELLGWHDGAVEVTAEDGWLILRQPVHLAGMPAARFSTLAALSGAGRATERIVLKPAHLELVDLPDDRHLLVAAVPDAGALLVVDPAVALAGAPVAVTAVVGTVDVGPAH